jgi:hypothetical protein
MKIKPLMLAKLTMTGAGGGKDYIEWQTEQRNASATPSPTPEQLKAEDFVD